MGSDSANPSVIAQRSWFPHVLSFDVWNANRSESLTRDLDRYARQQLSLSHLSRRIARDMTNAELIEVNTTKCMLIAHARKIHLQWI